MGSLLLMLGLGGFAVAGLLPPHGAHALGCPFAAGRFVVGQGGGNRLVNHHSGHWAQDHAVDIVGVGPFGFRVEGALPEDLARYAIYGAAVVSPCTGVVTTIRDGLPDLTPPERDPENAAGNSVCGDIEVELAHLAAGTLAVAKGDRIATGDPIARVGNTGKTTEPDLHLHAVGAASGQAGPVTLAGRTPNRKTVLEC
jgi:hypothetical protein